MTIFSRSGHFRTNRNGSRYWVSDHSVWRDDWSRSHDHASNLFYRRIEVETKGRTACFVDPNARCPVCGAMVYYYQNEAGSRVFFDDLSPPWPKHPCTDNRIQILSDRPTGRNKDERDALLQEAAHVGLDLDQIFANRRGQPPWHLMTVVKHFRSAAASFIVAESLENSRRIYFRIDSRVRDLKEGDIFSRKGVKISFLVSRALMPCEIKISIVRKLREFIDSIPTK